MQEVVGRGTCIVGNTSGTLSYTHCSCGPYYDPQSNCSLTYFETTYHGKDIFYPILYCTLLPVMILTATLDIVFDWFIGRLFTTSCAVKILLTLSATMRFINVSLWGFFSYLGSQQEGIPIVEYNLDDIIFVFGNFFLLLSSCLLLVFWTFLVKTAELAKRENTKRALKYTRMAMFLQAIIYVPSYIAVNCLNYVGIDPDTMGLLVNVCDATMLIHMIVWILLNSILLQKNLNGDVSSTSAMKLKKRNNYFTATGVVAIVFLFENLIYLAISARDHGWSYVSLHTCFRATELTIYTLILLISENHFWNKSGYPFLGFVEFGTTTVTSRTNSISS